MKKLLAILAAVGFVLTANAAMAAVAGTPHEYGGAADFGMCEVCHIPHAAQTGARIWREAAGLPVDDGQWINSKVGRLCRTCHNGGPLNSVANVNGSNPEQVASVYAATSHGRDWDLLSAAPAGAGGGVGDTPNASGNARPYVNGNGITLTDRMECTSCHDPHNMLAAEGAVRPFLRAGSNAPTTISGVCADCHERRLYNSVILANATSSKMHPVNILYTNSAVNGDTTLLTAAEMPGTLQVAVQLPDYASGDTWPLGGKFEGDLTGAPTAADRIGCGTCHNIHAPVVTTVAADQALHLLAIDNTGAVASLCQGCHGGPANVGIGKGEVGTGADHPIDMIPGTGGGPTIDRWYADGSTTREERHGGADDWPRGSGGNIICTSCHSAHNSSSDMGRLTRDSYTNASIKGGTVAFCAACHADPGPAGHHSNEYNWNGSNFPGGVTAGTPGIHCFDCHNGGSGSSFVGAHNGFGFTFTDAQNQYSNLCAGCHMTNPATPFDWSKDPSNATGLGAARNMPADNLGNPAGHNTSHFLGTFTDGANDINVKRNLWINGYSKYGEAGAHGSATDATGAALICESCHSVLYNADVSDQTSGYSINLLLQNYVDDRLFAGGETTGSGLCVACHNQGNEGENYTGALVPHSLVRNNTIVPSNMHPMTAWSITKAQDIGRTPPFLITGGATYATAATGIATGGALATGESYPGTNQMDCDSCHSPHRADSTGGVNGGQYDATQAGGAAWRPVILETSGPENGAFDSLCLNCHDY